MRSRPKFGILRLLAVVAVYAVVFACGRLLFTVGFVSLSVSATSIGVLVLFGERRDLWVVARALVGAALGGLAGSCCMTPGGPLVVISVAVGAVIGVVFAGAVRRDLVAARRRNREALRTAENKKPTSPSRPS